MTELTPPLDEDGLRKNSRKDSRKRSRSRIVWRILIGVTLSTLFLYLTLSNMYAWERTRALRDDLDQLQDITFTTRSKTNCLALYRNDVSVAIGQALAANNNLWVSIATRPFSADDSPEAQQAEAELNAELGRALDQSNEPLLKAVNELYEYDRLDPPPEVCPHPDASEEDHPINMRADD